MLDALGVHKRTRLTIPPFMSRRVASQHAYTSDAGATSYHVASAPPLHRHQQSRDNLTRFIDRVSPSAVFVWFSGGTANADHGSVMVYTNHVESQSGWYASFRRIDDWHLHKAQGISTAELMHLIEGGANAHASNQALPGHHVSFVNAFSQQFGAAEAGDRRKNQSSWMKNAVDIWR